MKLPARPCRNSGRAKAERFCGPHEQWVRGFACSGCGQLPGDKRNPIQAAHVRLGTGGGTSLKPSSRWVVSLCVKCHIHTQHARGEWTFWSTRNIDPKALAETFARRSPHWPKLREMP